MRFGKNLKYKNIRVARNGVMFDSKGEAARYEELKLLEYGKRIINLERQKEFALIVNGKKICTKIIDFAYYDCDTQKLVAEEFKGFMTREEKIKLKLFEALYPSFKLIISKAEKK